MATCTHPLHRSDRTCADYAVGCSSTCTCCLDCCPDCGTPAERRTCADCGASATVIDCGHFDQPAEIAASKYGGDPTCDACEAARDRADEEAAEEAL